MTLPKDVIATLKTLSDQEIVRRYGLPKHSIEIARLHHGIPSPPAKASIQARVVRLLKSGPKTTREVSAALPDVSQVGERLKIMMARRQIVRHNGKWKVRKMALKHLTPEQKAARLAAKRRRRYPTFPAMVADGKTLKEIVETLGVGVSTARLLRADFDIHGPSVAFPGSGAPRKTKTDREPKTSRAVIDARTKYRYEGVVAALKQPRTTSDISKEFGITPQRVRQIKQKFGVDRTPVRSAVARSADGLTKQQQACLKGHPEISDSSIPASTIEGVSRCMVSGIRRALGIKPAAKPSPVRDRVVAVVTRPMTVADIARALGPDFDSDLHLCLSVYMKSGHLKRISHGVYAPAKDLP